MVLDLRKPSQPRAVYPAELHCRAGVHWTVPGHIHVVPTGIHRKFSNNQNPLAPLAPQIADSTRHAPGRKRNFILTPSHRSMN